MVIAAAPPHWLKVIKTFQPCIRLTESRFSRRGIFIRFISPRNREAADTSGHRNNSGLQAYKSVQTAGAGRRCEWHDWPAKDQQVCPLNGQETNVKNAIKVLAILAALSLTGAAMAQDATTKPAAGAKGKVEKVDGMVITLKSKAGETTIETDANTTFTLDGQPATLADVKAGERVVSVTPSSGTASEVKLTSAKAKKKKAAPTTSPAAN
jgi:hypothetical protein